MIKRNLNDLLGFVTVSREGSFTRAAATLGAGRFADVDVGKLQRALVKDGVWLG